MDLKCHIFDKLIDIVGLYTFYYLENTKDFYTVGECHDFWEMVYVDSGEISVIAGNEGYHIGQGEMIFHKPMEFHALSANMKESHNVIVVTFKTSSESMGFFENKILTLSSIQKKILSCLLLEGQKAFVSLSRENVMKLKDEEVGATQLIINYLEQLFISLLRSNAANDRVSRESKSAKKNTENALAESIEKYLTENIYNNLKLEDVCKRFHMSKSYILQIFKESTNKSIMDYYINLKITEAKKLIRDGNLNFTQISEKLCYASIHHFSRIFKRKTGMTPTSYTNSVK